MLKTFIKFPMILNLFEGEGGGTTGATAPAAGEQTGDLSKVVYGKVDAPEQEIPQETTQQSDADSANQTEERTKAYRDLIQGEYKDLYNQDVQKIVKNRLKGMDELRQTLASQQEIIDRMSAKYGVTDLAELGAAIDNDSAMWEVEADAAGMTTDQYMKYMNLERMNAKLIREEQARAQALEREQRIQTWMQEAQNVQKQYPGFDLEMELMNPSFGRMLQSGVPMADAFKVIHYDDLQNATAHNAAQQAEAAVAANIRANGQRPVENGTRTQSAFTVKSDVSKLTKGDRAEIARRAARGEKIAF